jgi:PAS domain S-box-containing protein
MSTILIVEDDRTSLRVLSEILSTAGYATRHAESGAGAIQDVGAALPNLILLDIGLPDIDGIAVCRALRAQDSTKHVPVIFLSGASERQQRLSALEAGAVDFIPKPYDRSELLVRVKTHLTLAQLQAEAKEQRHHLERTNRQLQSEIAGREQIALSLKQSEERLNLALEAAQMGTWEIDIPTGQIWRSKLHDSLFGYTSNLPAWSQEKFLEHVIPEDRHRLTANILNSFSLGGRIDVECRIIRADDRSQRWLRLQGQVSFDLKNQPVRMLGTIIDITEQKLAEAELKALEVQANISQKLESVGRLASGVAHEINTPVQFISDNIQFLREAVTSLSEIVVSYRELNQAAGNKKNTADALEQIRNLEEKCEVDYLLSEIPKTFEETLGGLQRVTKIVRSLKEFAHPNQTARQPADINRAIETTIAVSRHEWKHVAEIVTDFDANLPPVPVVLDEFNQVILNLVVNAAHAISEALEIRGEAKGQITIQTKQAGDNALISIRDNGSGIPESARSLIFDPFFTTKGVGKGTGQGLTIARSIIVKNHGGQISFTTAEGVGTTFVIRIPLTSSPP